MECSRSLAAAFSASISPNRSFQRDSSSASSAARPERLITIFTAFGGWSSGGLAFDARALAGARRSYVAADDIAAVPAALAAADAPADE